jgi:hypothetical protein
MKALFSLLILSAVTAFGASRTQSDSDISKALIGTWIDAPSEREPMHGKVTYFADGHSVELVWPIDQTESSAIRIETRWSVTHSVLILTSVKSSNTKIVPVGMVIKDRILSISADRYVFAPSEGYGEAEKKSHVRVRPKTGA